MEVIVFLYSKSMRLIAIINFFCLSVFSFATLPFNVFLVFVFFPPIAICGSAPIDGAEVTVTAISHSPLHCGWLQVECVTAIVLGIALSGAQRALTNVPLLLLHQWWEKRNKKLVKRRVELWQEKSGPGRESVSACVSFSFGQVTALPLVLVCVCPALSILPNNVQ